MYGDFACVYDRLMKDVPYKKWADYYESLFRTFGKKPKLVLDLGCGTGTVTSIMQERGYDMIGVDSSEHMLSSAKEKAPDVLFLNQDMTDFELYGTVDAIISSLDSVNYILDEEDLLRCFKLVKNYLNYGGIFIFDINSAFKLKSRLGGHSFVEERDDIFYVWENEYDEDSKVCEFYLNLFIPQKDGNYHRIEEVQFERAYETEEIKSLLKEAGLHLLGEFAQFSKKAPGERTERIFFAAERVKE